MHIDYTVHYADGTTHQTRNLNPDPGDPITHRWSDKVGETLTVQITKGTDIPTPKTVTLENVPLTWIGKTVEVVSNKLHLEGILAGITAAGRGSIDLTVESHRGPSYFLTDLSPTSTKVTLKN